MPFLRFSRDKRGYEHTYLIHASHRKGAPARILYWYRTPPGVKVGRVAFDPDVRRALEAQYPGIAFDWAKLMDTTPPPPDVEHWRERRRQEKAARQARQAAERDEDPDEPSDFEPSAPDQPVTAAQHAPEHAMVMPPDADQAAAGATTAAAAESGESGDAAARPRKRRRRGGRRRRRVGPGESGAATAGGTAETSAPDVDPGADADGDAADGDDAPDVA